MPVRTELNLRLPNSPGALAEICRALSDERVNIVALSLESGGQLHLVVDNSVRAEGILRERRHKVTAREALVVSAAHSPGELLQVLSLISAAGVNLEYAYAGAAGVPGVPDVTDRGVRATVVLGVDDALRAASAAGV